MTPFLLLTRAVRRWTRHDGPGLSASVSFFAIFAMAPMLVFAVVGASKALGPERARAAAVDWLSEMVPAETAESLLSMIRVQLLGEGPWWTNVISGAVMVWAGSHVFVRLLTGTRVLFDDRPETPRGLFRRNLLGRMIALGLAVAAGLLILVFLVGSSLAGPMLAEWHLAARALLGTANAVLIAFGGVLLLRYVPSRRPPDRALLVAGGFYVVAFVIGRELFQAYIGRSAIASAYGVASSVVIFLVWIYAMACGYFIGAALCAEMSARTDVAERE